VSQGILAGNMNHVIARFPDGQSGAALLLLRNTLAAMLLSLDADHWANPSPWTFLALPIAACLCIGLLTPSAALGCIITIVASVAIHNVGFEQGAKIIALAVAVALLGPGAYSVDSRIRGGRRRIFPSED
jgi:uncharacterized membrane protein YphA (DoxX/SURF4 family)